MSGGSIGSVYMFFFFICPRNTLEFVVISELANPAFVISREAHSDIDPFYGRSGDEKSLANDNICQIFEEIRVRWLHKSLIQIIKYAGDFSSPLHS